MVATWKKEEAGELAKKMGDAKVFAIVGVSRIPSAQFQQIRKNLRGIVDLRVTRANVVRNALKKANRNSLIDHVKGSVGLAFTDLNPFKLERKVFENRIKSPAKAGSDAPEDIVVPKGDTPFAPGPIIGDLQKVGIKAKIQGGKIIVTEDSPVVRKGERISKALADVLARLGVKPMTIGLELIAVQEGEMIYPGSVLHIDEAETIAKIQKAQMDAVNLAFNARIYTKDTIAHFISQAAADARNLAFNAQVINKETVGFFLSKADAQMSVLKSILPPEVLDSAPKTEEKQG
jgi:large subunit ribosomal protein L10